MRAFLFIIVVLVASAFPAAADQTDPRLDGLFEELRTGDAIDAELTVARILEIWSTPQSPTVRILYDRAKLSADAEDFGLAGAILDHAIGLSPNFAQSFVLRGIVKLAEEDAEGALDDFSRALDLEPRQFEAHIIIAEILLSRDEKEKAYAQLQRALEWNPHNERARDRARALLRQISSQEI